MYSLLISCSYFRGIPLWAIGLLLLSSIEYQIISLGVGRIVIIDGYIFYLGDCQLYRLSETNLFIR